MLEGCLVLGAGAAAGFVLFKCIQDLSELYSTNQTLTEFVDS